MRYLGPGANKLMAYGVASVSGTILAVCSCTVLPLFAGIYAMGAGLGPAAAFSVLYFLVILLLCWLFYVAVMRTDDDEDRAP